METAIVAHYYTTPEVQQMADYVGDSLDLALWIKENKPKRVIHASVRFMAETAKILNPEMEVILPSSQATCSLVTQTNIDDLKKWRETYNDHIHVAYINSSVVHKTTADIIVTSRIVDNVINKLYQKTNKIIFSPDYNMGNYLNQEYGYDMKLWQAVCEVHDRFNVESLNRIMRPWSDGPKYIIAHPESQMDILKIADYVGSTKGMLNWVKDLEALNAKVYVATENGIIYNMQQIRPDIEFIQVPGYSGCKCSSCDYMKLNIKNSIMSAFQGLGGERILIDDKLIEQAMIPVNRMMEFSKTGEVSWIK